MLNDHNDWDKQCSAFDISFMDIESKKIGIKRILRM